MKRKFLTPFIEVICSAYFITYNEMWLKDNEEHLYREILKLLAGVFNDTVYVNDVGSIFFRHDIKDKGIRLAYHSDGRKIYLLNGRRHREDGPAYIDENNEFWYLNDKLVSKEDVLRHAVKRGNKEAVKKLLWNKY